LSTITTTTTTKYEKISNKEASICEKCIRLSWWKNLCIQIAFSLYVIACILSWPVLAGKIDIGVDIPGWVGIITIPSIFLFGIVLIFEWKNINHNNERAKDICQSKLNKGLRKSKDGKSFTALSEDAWNEMYSKKLFQ
jgi:hypothetical protein